jgi:hypothetical protein
LHDTPTFKPAAKTYLRFATDHPDGGRIGLFRSIELLEDDSEFPPEARPRLRSLLRWFNANLTVPRHLPQQAFCWFRSDAGESLQKIRILAKLYRRVGRSVWMQATRDPGRVVYRDAHQVAAVPHRDRHINSSAG